MKIRVAYYNEKFSWNKNWIFLGSSFKKLKLAEKKINGKRLKINQFLHESFDEELKNYLEWTEKQRIFYNDSIHWWMTELAGRNNGSSDFFLYICQIKSLKKILKNIKSDELLIVSDDILLIQSIIKNINSVLIKKSNLIKYKILQNRLNHYFKFIRSIIITLVDIIICTISARITLKKKTQPKGNIFLIHQYVEVDSLRNDKNIQSRYFPYLKEYFFEEKINLYFLTWSYFFWFGKIKAFKKLRSDSCFIPEDWLNFFDYISSIKNLLKVKSCFNIESEYPDMDVSHLILREKRIYLEQINSNLRFWTYLPALKKWARNCDSLTCIDHYENMNFEHALISATRNLDIKTKIIGYHHTLASKEFAAWHSLNSEWSSKFKPDYVMSLGSVSTKMLKEQGVPDERIIEGLALRYNNILIKRKNTNKKKNCILIPLSHIKDASLELITNVKKLGEEMQNTEYNFIIKPHPNLDISKILTPKELTGLPRNVSISNKDLDKLLDNYLLTILMSTGAAYNAVINGNIVFNLKSELNFSDNYLDIFEKEFRYVNSYSLNSIQNTLLEFIKSNKKIEEYSDEFNRLSKYLITGMNILNKKNLDKFRLK